MSKKRSHRSRLQQDLKKVIQCLRGRDGSITIRENSLTRGFSVTVVNRWKCGEKKYAVAATVQMYRHEAMKIYDFLGKVLA